MCIICGGQCGGIGNFIISIGLPFFGLYLLRLKNSRAKIKNKIIQRGPYTEEMPNEAIKCKCCGGALRDCREISTQSTDLKNLELLELKSHNNEPAGNLTGIAVSNKRIKLEKKGELKGVRGWLLLLCLILTIFIPASYLCRTSCALEQFILPKNKIQLILYNQSLLFNIIFIATMIFLAIFSFYAGLALWGLGKKAVKTSKIFLIIQLALTVIIVVIRPFMTFPLPGNGVIFGDIIKTKIPAFLHFSLWYLYLSNSSRVHNTYGEIVIYPG